MLGIDIQRDGRVTGIGIGRLELWVERGTRSTWNDAENVGFAWQPPEINVSWRKGSE